MYEILWFFGSEYVSVGLLVCNGMWTFPEDGGSMFP
jgi:hypothetical protein